MLKSKDTETRAYLAPWLREIMERALARPAVKIDWAVKADGTLHRTAIQTKER